MHFHLFPRTLLRSLCSSSRGRRSPHPGGTGSSQCGSEEGRANLLRHFNLLLLLQLRLLRKSHGRFMGSSGRRGAREA